MPYEYLLFYSAAFVVGGGGGGRARGFLRTHKPFLFSICRSSSRFEFFSLWFFLRFLLFACSCRQKLPSFSVVSLFPVVLYRKVFSLFFYFSPHDLLFFVFGMLAERKLGEPKPTQAS